MCVYIYIYIKLKRALFRTPRIVYSSPRFEYSGRGTAIKSFDKRWRGGSGGWRRMGRYASSSFFICLGKTNERRSRSTNGEYTSATRIRETGRLCVLFARNERNNSCRAETVAPRTGENRSGGYENCGYLGSCVNFNGLFELEMVGIRRCRCPSYSEVKKIVILVNAFLYHII